MKKKFTFIDVLVILAIVLVAFFVVFKFSTNGTEKENTKQVSYTVLVTGILPDVAETFVPEDRVLLDAKDDAYGKITDVSITPAEDLYLNQYTEEYVNSVLEERKDVKLTVLADATVHDYGYQIGQQHIRVGEVQYITAPTYVTSGYIIEVNE